MSKQDECVFCQIIQKEREALIFFEDNKSLAFLDKRPLFPGHTLLVPKAHIETFSDLPNSSVSPLFTSAKLLARVIEEVMEAEGTFIAINNKVSQSVPHLHIHIVPRRKKDGLKGFFWPRHPYRNEEHMLETYEKLKKALKND